jgi:hypothetical protein
VTGVRQALAKPRCAAAQKLPLGRKIKKMASANTNEQTSGISGPVIMDANIHHGASTGRRIHR